MANVLVAIVFACAVSPAIAQVPNGMWGTWRGNKTTTVLGPLTPMDGPPGVEDMLQISEADSSGSFFLRQLWGSQLFRVQGKLMQYCFESNLSSAEEAPFYVASNDSKSVKFCWRGLRLPTHKAGCTGCDCAQWTLQLERDVLHSVFYMSYPVIHMKMDLFRTGAAPAAETVSTGWMCEFNNHTGHPQRLLNKRASVRPSRSFCSSSVPRTLRGKQQLTSENKSQVEKFCVNLNLQHNVRLQYEPSQLPCWPCEMAFTVSADTPDLDDSASYVAIGVKGILRSYQESSPEVPDYWGMSTSDGIVSAGLGGYILLAYVDKANQSCARPMKADAYAGPPVDVADDDVFKNITVRRRNGRTTFSFAARMYAGNNTADLAWSGNYFGMQRVMWAIGAVNDEGGCRASLNYHDSARGLADLNFPAGRHRCDITDDTLMSSPRKLMLDTDVFV